MSERDELLTERQVADWLQVSVRTVQHWRHTGQGPAWVKVNGGRLVRYRVSDVDEFLAADTRGGAA